MQSLLNPGCVRDSLISKDPWAKSHGAIPKKGFLGTSLLYFTLAYLLPARIAVVIGSGSGYVPRLVRQAQREIPNEDFVKTSRCILIDADLDDKDFGSPDYHNDPSHFFRASYPDVEIWKMTSDQAVEKIKAEHLAIDFLHIDGDHTFAQSLKDFEQYVLLMSHDFIITMHDTTVTQAFNHDGCVPRTLAYLKNEMKPGGKYDHLEMVNFNDRNRNKTNYFYEEMLCEGTAIIKPRVRSIWETDLAQEMTNFLCGNILKQNLSSPGN